MSAPGYARAEALKAAQARLGRAARFLEMNARRPLFEKVMKLEGGRRCKVGLYLPGPVLVQFNPDTGEILAQSLPGRLDVLDPAFLDE